MKTLTTSILVAALTLTMGLGAEARSKGYSEASKYMTASHGKKGHGKKSKGGKKKIASNNKKKQKRDVASVKKKAKKKKSKRHHS